LAHKLNCFGIYKEINKIRKRDTKKENLELSLYILLLGITQNREDKNNIDISINQSNIKILNSIFNFKNYYENNLSKSPLEWQGNYEIQSTLYKIKSKFSINNTNIKNNKDINNDIIFTTKMKSLLDIIHFGISTKTPIFLEGSCGKGKSKEIDYYCKLTGLKSIKIVITKYTKIDD